MSGAAERTPPPEYLEKRNHKLASQDAKNKKTVAKLLKKEEDAKLKGDQKVAKLQAKEDKAMSKQDKFQSKIVKVDNKTQAIVAQEPKELAKQEKVVLKCEEKLKAYMAKLDQAKDNPKVDYKRLDAMNDTVIKKDVKIREAKAKHASITEKNRLKIVDLTVQKEEAQSKIDHKLKTISLKKRNEEYKRDLKVHNLQVKKAVAMRNDELVAESLSNIRPKVDAPPPPPPIAEAPVVADQEAAPVGEQPPASAQSLTADEAPERPPSRGPDSQADMQPEPAAVASESHDQHVASPPPQARDSNAGHGDVQGSTENVQEERKHSSAQHDEVPTADSRGSIPQESVPPAAEGTTAA